MKERKAFTLTEVLVAVAIMSIMAGVMALNSATVGQQSAKREAERVAAFIQGHISRENMAKRGLWFEVQDDSIKVWHSLKGKEDLQEDPELKASNGCKYSSSSPKMCYGIRESVLEDFSLKSWKLISKDNTAVTDSGTKAQYYITVEGADKESVNVIIGRKR